jgi:hypothetical protein
MDQIHDNSMLIRGQERNCAAIYSCDVVKTLTNRASIGASDNYAYETLITLELIVHYDSCKCT